MNRLNLFLSKLKIIFVISVKNFRYIFIKPVLPQDSRYSYQTEFVNHDFSPKQLVLDIGSGGDPFPYATILADRYINSTSHRSAKFSSEGKPVVVCDVQFLPFADNQFEYVACCHVLEHVDDPISACKEIQRVGNSGLIETPRLMKDALFSWAELTSHKWYIEKISNRLVFFEYDKRLIKGVNSNVWQKLIFTPIYHPLQEIFRDNQDIFNVIFNWKNEFNVSVFRDNGCTESYNCQ
jgi:SAM-dependent methyltransferase